MVATPTIGYPCRDEFLHPKTGLNATLIHGGTHCSVHPSKIWTRALDEYFKPITIICFINDGTSAPQHLKVSKGDRKLFPIQIGIAFETYTDNYSMLIRIRSGTIFTIYR